MLIQIHEDVDPLSQDNPRHNIVLANCDEFATPESVTDFIERLARARDYLWLPRPVIEPSFETDPRNSFGA